MALMKKRVLAEFNQSQVISVEPPLKRQRLLRYPSTGVSRNGTSSEGSSALAFIDCLDKCKGGNDTLQLLVRISDTLCRVAQAEVPAAVTKLVERYAVETEAAVRTKILWVIAELGEGTNDTDEKLRIIEETAKLLRIDDSHRVKSQGLSTLLKLGGHHRSVVVKVALEHLCDTWHGVQTRCLSILGRYLPENAGDDVIGLVASYARSQDPRVRAVAFETMAELHSERGCKLPSKYFVQACNAVQDDYEIVRRAVLKLMWLLGNQYRDVIMSGVDGEDLRMIDCAFSKMCGLMGDLSPRVRAAVMTHLGKMKGVSRRYIDQALDKKQKRVEDEATEIEERSGSCGAFIHGLEDEFLEVRTAAVESLCTLCLEEPKIARTALDFMVDMFNDEIQDVRIRAIESLRKMSASVTLQEDQLETILSALEDYSDEVREGLHATLAASRVATMRCLHMCVNRLIDNLTRYPQDRDSIRSCLAKMGRAHPYLTLPLVPQLLGRHPFFDTPEPDVDEPTYASILVLIFNAALYCPTMVELFTEHATKHYHYLRDTMPQLVPRLRPSLNDTPVMMRQFVAEQELKDRRGRDFLERIVAEVEAARPGGRVQRQLMEAAANNLERLAEMDDRMQGAANFTAFYIRCLLLLKTVVKEISEGPPNSETTSFSPNATSKIAVLLRHAQKLRKLYTALDENETALAHDVWLKALAVELIRITKGATGSALPLAQTFIAEVNLIRQDTPNLPPFSLALLQIPSLGESKPGALSRLLLPLLTAVPERGEERLPRPSAPTRLCRAVIEEPRTDGDSAMKFTGGLVLGISLTAKIFNLRDASALRVKLRHPDQHVQLILPKASDLRSMIVRPEEEGTDYRLRTLVLLSHQVWMEACNVEISLALIVPSANHWLTDEPCILDLCKPTKVAIAPRPIKRGI